MWSWDSSSPVFRVSLKLAAVRARPSAARSCINFIHNATLDTLWAPSKKSRVHESAHRPPPKKKKRPNTTILSIASINNVFSAFIEKWIWNESMILNHITGLHMFTIAKIEPSIRSSPVGCPVDLQAARLRGCARSAVLRHLGELRCFWGRPLKKRLFFGPKKVRFWTPIQNFRKWYSYSGGDTLILRQNHLSTVCCWS